MKTNAPLTLSAVVDSGGEVLVPGPPERTVQFIDVRDLASWLIDLSERKAGGRFNATNEGIGVSPFSSFTGSVPGLNFEMVHSGSL